MAENVCHSILKTATQQIVQSAGFEGANNQSIDTLTEIFGRYIELLGSTVTAYANLNGRTTGTAKDVSETLDELHLDAKMLKDWLEQDGKTLSPSWSAQSDPGRVLQGVINGGKPTFDDIIEFQFGDLEEFELLSPELSPSLALSTTSAARDEMDEEAEEPPTPSADTDKHLPDYIPAYFPAFPAEMKGEDTDEAATVLKQQLEAEKEKQQKQKQKQSASALPLPNIVKKRKKPIDNPFTHLIPYEDSSLATEDTVDDATTTTNTVQSPSQSSPQQPPAHLSLSQQKPLFLLLKSSAKRNDIADQNEEDSTIHHNNKRRKSKHAHSTGPLVEALQTIEKSAVIEVGEGLKTTDTTDGYKKRTSEQYNELLRKQVEDAAAPGNHLFYREDRILDDIVQRVAPPIAVSKLMSPNLLTDVAIVSSGSNSSSSASGTTAHGTSGVGTGSTDGKQNKYNGSNSMLAALAKGASAKKGYSKKFGKTGLSISKHSVDINAKKVGESKYLMKKRRMLAEKQAAAERQRILEERLRENPGADVEALKTEIEREQQQQQQQQEHSSNNNNNNHLNLHKIPQSPSQNTTIDHSYSHTASPTDASPSSSQERKPSFSVQGPRAAANTLSPSQQSIDTVSAAKTGPISLSSYLANTATDQPTVEKKRKPKKTPSLTLNLVQSKQNGESNSTVSSPNQNGSAPRIRFKLKPPEQQTPTSDQKMKYGASNASHNNADSAKSVTDHMKTAPNPSSFITKHNDAGLVSSSSANGNSYNKPAISTETVHDRYDNYNSPAYNAIPNAVQHSLYSDYTSYPAATATGGNEEINCICSNPSVDYGTFMIACDSCSTWFHGTCVGIAESDPIEEWFCKRCRRKALSP